MSDARRSTMAWAPNGPTRGDRCTLGAASVASPDQWRWTDDDGVQRLLGSEELRAALRSGKLRADTLVWRRGMTSWQPAESVRELAAGSGDTATTAPRDLGPKADATPSVPPVAERADAAQVAADGKKPRLANMIDIAALRDQASDPRRATLVGMPEARASSSAHGGADGSAHGGASSSANGGAIGGVSAAYGAGNSGESGAAEAPAGAWASGAARPDVEQTVTRVRAPSDRGTDNMVRPEVTVTNALPEGGARGGGARPEVTVTNALAAHTGAARAEPPPATIKGGAREGAAVGETRRPSSAPPPPGRSRRAVAAAPQARAQTLASPAAERSQVESRVPEVAIRLARTSAGSTQARDSEAASLVRPRDATLASEDAVAASRGAARNAQFASGDERAQSLGVAATEVAVENSRRPQGLFSVPPTAPLPQWPPRELQVAGAPSFAAESWRPPSGRDHRVDEPSRGGAPEAAPAAPRSALFAMPSRRRLVALGAVSVALLGLSFGFGRATAPASGGVERARHGWAPLVQQAQDAETAAPRPCLMLRAPSSWASEAERRVAAELVATNGGKIAIGFARRSNEPRGLVLDPSSGEVVDRFEPPPASGSVARVVPVPTQAGATFVVVPAEHQGMTHATRLRTARSVTVGTVGGELMALGEGGAKARLWSLPNGTAARLQLAPFGPDGREGHGIVYTVGDEVHYGAVRGDGTVLFEGKKLAAGGGKTGKPMIASNGREVSIVFAEEAAETGRVVLRWARGPVDKPLTEAGMVELPVGGPGGDAIAPDVAALSGGRWFLLWTEGKKGDRVLRAQTYDRRGERIGDALRVSPATGNFGQGTLAVAGETAAVAFFLSTGQAYQLWGTVLQCN